MASEETKQGDFWSAADQAVDMPRDPRPRLLPHNLDASLKYLTDGELQTLAAAVTKEQTRRSPKASTHNQTPPTPASPPHGVKSASKVEGLTQSQINLIRASVKAGVKPSILSRQFGISRTQIRAALEEK